MKFTLSWLREHLDTTASLDEIVNGLIGVGLEVEEVSDEKKTGLGVGHFVSLVVCKHQLFPALRAIGQLA